MFFRVRPLAPALVIAGATACFTYADLPRAQVQPGREVRIDLTPDGRDALAARVGPRVRTISGRLRAADTSGVTVALEKTTLVDGVDNGWNGEVAVIPYHYIDQTRERRLSTSKTVGLMVLAAGGATALMLLIGRGSSTSSSSAGGGGAK